MSRIGVFVCHCGENIGATVDCAKVAETASHFPGVIYSIDYKYMCSDPGQNFIKEAIRNYNLNGVVVAACSPRMHEPTFRRAMFIASRLRMGAPSVGGPCHHCGTIEKRRE